MGKRRDALIRRRRALGLNQEEAAEKLGVERSTLSRWERGENDPQPWHRRRLAAVLEVTPDELDLMLFDPAEELATAVLRNDSRRGGLWNANSGTVTAEDLQRIGQTRVHFQEMYRRVGGIPTMPRISAILDQRVAPMLRAAYDNDLGRRLFRAAGSLTAFAGVCAYDADQQMAATARFAEALGLARASADLQFEGYLHALLANQAMHLGDLGQVLDHTENVLDILGDQLGPALVCDLHSLAAKARARMGDTPACHRHLEAAETSAGRTWDGPELPEASYMTPA